MKIAIHQPAYLPWTGYFHKIKNVDLFVFLDNVQFQKGSFQNRNKIYTKQGPIWLTIPTLNTGAHFNEKIKDLGIDNNQRWQSKHLKSLHNNYSKALMFKKIMPKIEEFYHKEALTLSEFCWDMLNVFNEVLEIKTPMVKASEMQGLSGMKSDLILNICKLKKASVYLSGDNGKNYLVEKDFMANGISIQYQNYKINEYKQLGKEFMPALGIVDLLFNSELPNLYI